MNKQGSEVERITSSIHQIIEENLDNEKFSVEDLAQQVGLSRSTLHRHLLKTIGKSASDLINEKRLSKAKELLEQNATVSEAAFKVGFSDPSYFTKVFKKYYKTSPGELKKSKLARDEFEESAKQREGSFISRNIPRMMIVLLPLIILAGGLIYLVVNDGFQVKKSIAVLPLDNLTGNPENSYFVDGLQDALIGELGRLSTIRVISRTSTLRYRNSEMLLADIADELDVNTIVEGSVQCLGDSICFIVQVIDVFPKERHLLAHEYYDGMDDVLNVQKTVVRDIAQRINVKLTREEEEIFNQERKVNPETYADYLRGMYDFSQGTLDTYLSGIDHMRNAIKRDPGDPLGHAGLALGYALIGHGVREMPEAFVLAEVAANKALKLDPSLDEANIAIGMLNLFNLWDWTKAEQAFERALASNPNNELAHANYAWYHVLFDDKERTLYHAKMATVLDPVSPMYYSWYAYLCVFMDEYELAEEAARKCLELMENNPFANVVMGWVHMHRNDLAKAVETHEKLPIAYPYFKVALAYTYLKAGERDKAIALRNELEEAAKSQWINPLDRGMISGMLGFTDEAFELIAEACEHHYYPSNHMRIYLPGLEFINEDSRYRELFRQMNLPFEETILAASE